MAKILGFVEGRLDFYLKHYPEETITIEELRRLISYIRANLGA